MVVGARREVGRVVVMAGIGGELMVAWHFEGVVECYY